jgi:hypothetical protein
MAENLKTPGHERCRSLASKEMLCEVEGSEPAHAGGSGLFWCSQTLSCLGPDGQSVHHEDCKPGRSCYEAL